MDIKDYLSIGFSFISLAISITALYLSQFRPARVTASIGPMIHIFYLFKGNPKFYLPVVFHNESPTKAIVYKVMVELVNTNGDCFGLKWIESVKVNLDNTYTATGPAAPFKIDGYEAVSNVLTFFWPNRMGAPRLLWLAGKYSIKLHVWTSNSVFPTFSRDDTFTITPETAELMSRKIKTGDISSQFFPLDGKGLISFCSGKEPIDFRSMPGV